MFPPQWEEGKIESINIKEDSIKRTCKFIETKCGAKCPFIFSLNHLSD